jgi:hypothetical protein
MEMMTDSEAIRIVLIYLGVSGLAALVIGKIINWSNGK